MDGFMVELLGPIPPTPIEAVTGAIAAAQTGLIEYVNRRGNYVPSGLSGPGLSFWLMEKTDGTAMGTPIGDAAA
jgi:hypothetical protein